jgi:hypothetical protein
MIKRGAVGQLKTHMSQLFLAQRLALRDMREFHMQQAKIDFVRLLGGLQNMSTSNRTAQSH